MAQPGIRVLGPVAIEGGRGPVTTSSSLLRTLLALLAVRPGEVVATDTLIDELWSASTTLPRDPRAALQAQASRLRGWLAQAGVDRGALRFESRGYVLDVARDRVDLARFGDAVLAAERETDPEAVVAVCDRALAEWRDDPFGGCALGFVLEAEQVRQRERHLRTIERRAEALLDLDRAADVVVDLAGPRHQHLAHERLTELRMTALFRTGRQQEALAAFDETRRHLAEEHGLAPGAALVRAEAAVLAHDPSLMGERRPRTGPGTRSAAWRPSGDGSVSDREVAEAFRLSDHLGHWVELLPDDDARLPEAEATRNALDAELRLARPRRGMLRAIVQATLDMLRSEVDELTTSVAELLDEPQAAARSIVPEAPPDDVSIAEPDRGADEEWQVASDHVTDLAEAVAAELPDDVLPEVPATATATVGEEAKPGRGTVIVAGLRWAGKEGVSGMVRAGAVAAGGGAALGVAWLANHGPSGVARVVESLLNLVGI